MDFRLVVFGRPASTRFLRGIKKLVDIGKARIVQFPPLGMAIPEDHPDRNRYLSMAPRHEKWHIGFVKI